MPTFNLVGVFWKNQYAKTVLSMAKWMYENDAFIWTDLDGDAYQLILFNQSRTGVYVVYSDFHQSFHRDGNCHSRPAKGAEYLAEVPYKLPPLAQIQTHLLGSHWFSTNPDAVRSFGRRIPHPSPTSGALFIN